MLYCEIFYEWKISRIKARLFGGKLEVTAAVVHDESFGKWWGGGKILLFVIKTVQVVKRFIYFEAEKEQNVVQSGKVKRAQCIVPM